MPLMTASWVDRLEKRIGFLEVPNLAAFMAGMNALSAVLTLAKPEFSSQLILDPYLMRHGQVWRALTFILVPPVLSPLWLFFWLLLYFSWLNALQRSWGDFKFTLYVLLGALATAGASIVTGIPLSSGAFVWSLFFAFARLNPELELLLFFFFPVKIKWLAAVAWALTAWRLMFDGFGTRVELAAGLLNYLLYFGSAHFFELKQLWRRQRYRS